MMKKPLGFLFSFAKDFAKENNSAKPNTKYLAKQNKVLAWQRNVELKQIRLDNAAQSSRYARITTRIGFYFFSRIFRWEKINLCEAGSLTKEMPMKRNLPFNSASQPDYFYVSLVRIPVTTRKFKKPRLKNRFTHDSFRKVLRAWINRSQTN